MLPFSDVVIVRYMQLVYAWAAVAVVFPALSLAQPAAAITEPVAYRCNFAHSPPVIDGLGSDACWEDASPIRNFRKAWLTSSEGDGSNGVSQL
ncbi:MAG: hypothetical protein FJ308_22915, partial [Planctomycetes bacterium]|nr:hypothetical protein [Planctomycetota bacterium]